MLAERLSPALVAIALGAVLFPVLLARAGRAAQRRGVAVDRGRLALSAAALVYGIALPAFVLLPLPGPEYCTGVGAPTQLVPLQFVADIVREQGGAGIGALPANPALQGVLLNVALFLPLGVFLRAMARRSTAAAVAIGPCVSLLLELTQLTGLWGVYECPYRIFDVDDLMTNTVGVLLGAHLVTLVRRVGNAAATPVSEPADVHPPRAHAAAGPPRR